MSKQLEGLCEHGRLTTAYCGDCALLAEIYIPNKQIDWDSLEKTWVELPDKHTGGSSDYYDLPPGCTRLYDIMWKKDMGVDQENIFKAAYRWDIKPDLIYNLRKIIFFATERLKRELK